MPRRFSCNDAHRPPSRRPSVEKSLHPGVYVLQKWQFTHDSAGPAMPMDNPFGDTRTILPQAVSPPAIVLDTMAVGLALIDRHGVCLYANATLAAMLGRPVAELSFRPFHSLVHEHDQACPDGGAALNRLIEALAQPQAGRQSDFEVVFCRERDGPFVAACRATGVLHGGAPATVLEISDVTARRQAELSARTQELAYRFAADAARIGSWSRDFRSDAVMICPVMAELLELPSDRMLLSDAQWRGIIVPEDLPQVEADMARHMAGGSPNFALEFRVRTRTGKQRWHTSRGTVIRDEHGMPLSVTGMSIDITDRKAAEAALRASEERFRMLSELSPCAILVYLHDRYVYANQAAADLVGAADGQDILGRSPRDFIDPRFHALLARRIEEVMRDGRTQPVELELQRLDGSRAWIISSAGRVTWEDEPAIQIVARDITAERDAREKLRLLGERVNLALASAGEAVWDWDIQADTYRIAGGLRDLFGWHEDPAGSGRLAWDRSMHPDDVPRVRAALRDCAEGRTASYQCEFRLRTLDGAWRWLLGRGIVVARDEDGAALAMTGTMSDITVRKETEDMAWRHANLDALTGLPNRRLFRERLEHEVRKSRRSGRPLALLFIDLDRFKQVNDWLGHAAGDQLLVEAAERIRRCVRQTDTVARLGGDEFTVMLADLDGQRHVEFVCHKILEALSAPFYLGNDVAYISGSIGVALHPMDAGGSDDLMRKADQAMYAAKEAGKQQFKYFTRSMDETAHRRLQITGELRHAIDNGQLSVHYQPVVSLHDGSVVKAEALVRWQHPWLGNIEPSFFIPLAEESGLIGRISDWVLEQVMFHARRWRTPHGKAVQVGVNQSPLQFAMADPKSDRVRHLIEANHDAGSIAIEITEGMLLDATPAVKEKLLLYRDAGIQVAIDDFGTGYSSMSYLQQFGIDYLKIDRSFVQDIASNEAHRTIAETIILMAHKLGLEVIAEGIETAEQMDCLRRAGCDYGQGFLFSPAVPVVEFERLLSGDLPAARHLH